MKSKKLLLFATVMAVFGTAFYSCTPKSASNVQDNVKYYRQLLFSETPWDTEAGSHPLSPGEEAKVNNYKFTYDENQRLVSVEYNRNGVLLDYSSMGAAKITYEYRGNKQLKHFFNQDNQPTDNGGATVYEYTLNDQGKRVSMRFLDKDGNAVENRNKIHNYEWTAMPDGMIRELRYNLAGDTTIMNPFCPFFELRFTYDSNGYVTRMANYDADTLYNCTAENCGDIGVSYFLFEPNSAGDLLTFSVHNTTGRLSNLYWGWAKRVNKVDEYGYVVETALFDQDDEYLGGKSVPVTQTVYDQFGAPVQRINLDKNRIIINNPENGVATTEYKYDEQGRRTDTLKFDKDKVKVEEKS